MPPSPPPSTLPQPPPYPNPHPIRCPNFLILRGSRWTLPYPCHHPHCVCTLQTLCSPSLLLQLFRREWWYFVCVLIMLWFCLAYFFIFLQLCKKNPLSAMFVWGEAFCYCCYYFNNNSICLLATYLTRVLNVCMRVFMCTYVCLWTDSRCSA